MRFVRMCRIKDHGASKQYYIYSLNLLGISGTGRAFGSETLLTRNILLVVVITASPIP